MTDDLFERRLRRDLDVIAAAVTVGTSPRPVLRQGHDRPGRASSRKAAGVALLGAAAAAVLVATVVRWTSDPGTNLVTAADPGDCPQAVAPNPADGEFVVASGEVDGTSWEVRTTGTGTAPDVALRAFVEGNESSAATYDASSWSSAVNRGLLSWTYSAADNFTVLYGLLPPEVDRVRATIAGDTVTTCATAITGQAFRYFALPLSAMPSAVVAESNAGKAIVQDPGAGLRRNVGSVTGVSTTPIDGTVALPIGGTAVEDHGTTDDADSPTRLAEQLRTAASPTYEFELVSDGDTTSGGADDLIEVRFLLDGTPVTARRQPYDVRPPDDALAADNPYDVEVLTDGSELVVIEADSFNQAILFDANGIMTNLASSSQPGAASSRVPATALRDIVLRVAELEDGS